MSVTSPVPLSPSERPRIWIWQISLLSIVLGVLLALALQTQRRIASNGLPPRYSALASRYVELNLQNKDFEKEIENLRDNVSKLENALKASSKTDSNRPQVDALGKQIQEYKLFAGLTTVEGPGIEVVLSDHPKGPQLARERAGGNDQGQSYQDILSDYLVHDQDILGVVNELKAAGAEAISVNGQRILATTSIRCVGPICYINGQPVGGSAPYTIIAIGSPRELENGLRLPGGYLEGQQLFEYQMASIRRKNKVRVPGYEGVTLFKFAQPAPETPPLKAADAAGISYSQLCDRLIELALEDR